MLSEPENNLWATVRNNIRWYAVQLKNMLLQQLRCPLTQGQFGQGNEMDCLGKTIYYGEYDRVTLGGRRASNKINCYV